uniref:Carboxypeptidase n=1 Tax=Ditylenchus dipsaci TaxID=166011 RepID=A0A915DQT0_9BILA
MYNFSSRSFLLAFTASCFAISVYSQKGIVGTAKQDEIKNLPGVQFDVKFRHYSGYLQVSSNHFLHYWFVESQKNPSDDPLVFWFNGGPGCSSVGAGLLKELGPYIVNSDGKTLHKNPDSWNKLANVVFIESPAGVGHSYSTDGNITTNDDLTAEENYEAVKQFMANIKLSETILFLLLEKAMLGFTYQHFPRSLLMGIAIGNGIVNDDLDFDTMIRFGYGHGIIGESYWKKITKECCRGNVDKCQLSLTAAPSTKCSNMVLDCYNYLWSNGLNPYDIYRKCDGNSRFNSIRLRITQQSVLQDERLFQIQNESMSLKEKAELFPLSFKDADLSPKDCQNTKAQDSDALVNVPCLVDGDVSAYLNNAEVKKALHIPEGLEHWEICSGQSFYTKVRKDMTPYVKKLIDANVRVLLFYGDTDLACNFLMGEQFAANLGLKEIGEQKPWKFQGQIAGFQTTYEHDLTYITVLGAGHMAPEWRAPEVNYAMKQFLANKPII